MKYKIQELTQKNLQKIWEGNFPRCNYTKEEIQYIFELRLFQYAAGRVYDSNFSNLITSSYRKKSKQFQRLLLGVYGIPFKLSPFRSGLSSKRANEKGASTTADHIIGVTLAGQFIKRHLDQLVDNKYQDSSSKKLKEAIEHMSNDFLPKHLWLWATCRITKEEHKSNNLLRGDLAPRGIEPIKYKANFMHYDDAKIKIKVEAYK